VHGRGLAGGVVDQPEVQVRPHLGFEAYKLEVDHDAIRGLACRGPLVVGVVPDAPLVAADSEGRRPDAVADADALVEAVVGDLERVRAPRLLHGARRSCCSWMSLLLPWLPIDDNSGGNGDQGLDGTIGAGEARVVTIQQSCYYDTGEIRTSCLVLRLIRSPTRRPFLQFHILPLRCKFIMDKNYL
jgi:hypothetical protein